MGVLAGGVLVAINPLQQIRRAQDTQVKNDIGQITNAMQAYYVLNLSYPTAASDLVASGNLKTEPKTPDGDTYIINTTPTGCTTANKDCTDATVEAPLAAVTDTNLKWDSATNQITEVGPPPTPTPTPTLTPTPVPDNYDLLFGDLTYNSANDCNALQGWVCDRDYQPGPLTIKIYDGPKSNGRLVASGQTTWTWGGTNVPAVCGSSAQNTGYSFTTPASIKDGVPRTLYYYGISLNRNGQPGSRGEVGGSSEPFKCPR